LIVEAGVVQTLHTGGKMHGKPEIESHLPLVRRIAGRIKSMLGPPLEVDDLVSYGVIGLTDALERFRPETGVPFESFAHYRIRGAILEGISRQCPLSRHAYRRLRLQGKAGDHMEMVARDLAGAGQRSPEADASMIASSIRDLASIYTVARLARRYEDDGPEMEFEDPSARRAHEERVRRGEIRDLIDRLPDDQARLLRLYYFEDLTLEEAGTRLGFRKSWACKLHKAALARLREMMSPTEGSD
jgi:RNA polymerase sigma factor for flagellar operon FliA